MKFIKIPSLSESLRLAKNVLQQYPWTVISALLATGAACYNVELDYTATPSIREQVERLMMVSGSGISLFTAIVLALHLKSVRVKWAGQLLGLVLLVIYYFSLSNGVDTIDEIRYFLFMVASHLLVAISPFLLKGGVNAFWQFNKYLFLRILTAVLFAGVLYLGLVLALLAVENLFGLNIDDDRYFQLFFIMAGIFQTIFFLAGIPEHPLELEEDERYPRGLSIFSQYVLVPLVVLYSIIQYLYTAKIIVQWDWPRGWIGYLFIGYSVSGILSYLLIYPQIDFKTNRWLLTFRNWFFISLLPLCMVLFLAIYRRSSEYGITENRYFLYVVCFWVLAIAGFFIFRPKLHLKWIPISLSTIVLLSSFGPWGAFSVSMKSQVNRFGGIIQQYQKTDSISFKEKKSLSSTIMYLWNRQELDQLQPYFKMSIDSLLETNASFTTELLDEYGLDYVSQWQTESDQSIQQAYYLSKDIELDITGYDRLIFINPISSGTQVNDTSRVALDYERLTVSILKNREDSIHVDLKPVMSNLKEFGKFNYDMPVEQMTVIGKAGDFKYKIYFSSLGFDEDEGELDLNFIEFYLLFTEVY